MSTKVPLSIFNTVHQRNEAYQAMSLGFCKIIAAIQRIKPKIEKKARKIAIPQDKTARAEVLTVLRDDQVHIFFLEVCECLDDAIWRNDGCVLHHHRFEFTPI